MLWFLFNHLKNEIITVKVILFLRLQQILNTFNLFHHIVLKLYYINHYKFMIK